MKNAEALKTLYKHHNTRRGPSRAQHVRDREADIERAKKCGLGHLHWVVFLWKIDDRCKWRGPKGRADTLAMLVLWRKDRTARPVGPSRRARFWWRLRRSDQKRQILAPIVTPNGVDKGTSTSCCVNCPSSSRSVTANPITTFLCAYTVCNGSKITTNGWFLKNRK